jgi:hypothetical protein
MAGSGYSIGSNATEFKRRLIHAAGIILHCGEKVTPLAEELEKLVHNKTVLLYVVRP